MCTRVCEWMWAGMCLLASVSKWDLLYVSFQNVGFSDTKGRHKDRKGNKRALKEEIRESRAI